MSTEAAIVARANDPLEAQIWVDALRDAGLEAGMIERGPGAALGGAFLGVASYPILVRHDQLEPARNIIAELGGAESLAPYSDPAEASERRRAALMTVVGVMVLVVVSLALLRLASG